MDLCRRGFHGSAGLAFLEHGAAIARRWAAVGSDADGRRGKWVDGSECGVGGGCGGGGGVVGVGGQRC